MSSRTAIRESFFRVGETCPAVDEAAYLFRNEIERAFEVFIDRVKDQTGALRTALTDAISEKLEADEKINDLERELYDLKERLRELEGNV